MEKDKYKIGIFDHWNYYDFRLYLNGKRLIIENDIETTKYIQCIYDALQKIDLLYKKGKN